MTVVGNVHERALWEIFFTSLGVELIDARPAVNVPSRFAGAIRRDRGVTTVLARYVTATPASNTKETASQPPKILCRLVSTRSEELKRSDLVIVLHEAILWET